MYFPLFSTRVAAHKALRNPDMCQVVTFGSSEASLMKELETIPWGQVRASCEAFVGIYNLLVISSKTFGKVNSHHDPVEGV